MTYIYKLDNNSLIAIILFLQTDDIYEYSETCKMFYNITKYIQKLSYIPNYLKFNKPPCDYHYVQSINLIKWAKQHKNFNYTNTTANYASRRGNLDILKYLYNDNCNMYNNENMILHEASKNGYLDILKWGIKKGFVLDEHIFIGACEFGDLNIVKWLYKMNCPFNDYCCHHAALYGNQKVLDFLIYDVECSYNIMTFNYAAQNGQIKILKYLNDISTHDLSRPWWGTSTCAVAAEFDNLSTLKWLRNNLCPWDKHTTYNASINNNIKTLNWAIKNGCEIDNKLFQILENSFGLKFKKEEVNLV
jgi:hypothetical protein